MLPPTCYNCGKAIGELETQFEIMLKNNKGDNIKNILDDLEIRKICCRILFLASINECKILVK